MGLAAGRKRTAAKIGNTADAAAVGAEPAPPADPPTDSAPAAASVEPTVAAAATVADDDIEVLPPARAKAVTATREFAQGRRQPNLTLEDLPEPVDVGEKEGPLDEEEVEILGWCDRALSEFFTAELVGVKALLNVQERKLYRDEFDTFEEFVQDRFQRGRLWAYRQIERYQVSLVLGELFPIGNKMLPESHARELAPVLDDADAVQAIYKEAVDSVDGGTKLTAKALRETRERLYPRVPTQMTRKETTAARPVRDLRRALAKVQLSFDASAVEAEAEQFPEAAAADREVSLQILSHLGDALRGTDDDTQD
jgi:hypothetical protein